MTRKKARILVMLLSVVCLLSVTCLCFAETPSILRYKHTSRITAYLGISGGTADCRGSVAPSEPVDCSLRVVLYKQSGNSWIQVASWTASAAGGATARLSKSTSVGSGTYKVVSYGTVAGEASRGGPQRMARVVLSNLSSSGADPARFLRRN